ncbi:MAG: YceH family protein [Wenzhouxiangellaceae bacterium]
MSDANETTDHSPNWPVNPPLDTIEARVLGCLIEKESTTPDAYPLTLNATVTACNQKTSRHPVMKLNPGEVGQALRQLEKRGLARSEYGARAERWSHRVDAQLKITAAQRSLLGLLLLRGPQTPAELLAHGARMHGIDDIEDLRHALERMAGRDPALVVQLPRAPGQREARYAHLLCGAPVADAAPATPAGDPDPGRHAALEARLQALADQLDELTRRVEALERR